MSVSLVAQVLVRVASHKVEDDSLLALDEFLSNSNELGYTFTNDMGESYTIVRTAQGFMAGTADNSGDPATADQLDAHLRLANKVA